MKPSNIIVNEDGTIHFEDSQYVIMTEDKKCIIRGRKNTAFVLTTLDEECSKKVYTCTQYKVMLEGLMDKYDGLVILTDNVMELYNVSESYYDVDKLPKLVAVKAKANIQVKLN